MTNVAPLACGVARCSTPMRRDHLDARLSPPPEAGQRRGRGPDDWVVGNPETLPSMLERLHNMPDGTVGFRIDGDVEDEDYAEILVPALKAAVDSGQGLRRSI